MFQKPFQKKLDAEMVEALAGNVGGHPVWPAFRHTVRRFGIPTEYFHEMIDGVLGDPTLPPKAGDEVTVSVRPECWVIGRERKGQNCVEGVIGNAVYLGEMAQYDFVCAGMTLKIVELNPRFAGSTTEGTLLASVDPEDAVVLVE